MVDTSENGISVQSAKPATGFRCCRSAQSDQVMMCNCQKQSRHGFNSRLPFLLGTAIILSCGCHASPKQNLTEPKVRTGSDLYHVSICYPPLKQELLLFCWCRGFLELKTFEPPVFPRDGRGQHLNCKHGRTELLFEDILTVARSYAIDITGCADSVLVLWIIDDLAPMFKDPTLECLACSEPTEIAT